MLFEVDAEKLEASATLEMAWNALAAEDALTLIEDVQEIRRDDDSLMAVIVFVDEEAMVEWEGMVDEEDDR